MQTSQTDILNQCLTLIERGQITPEQCVARYPEFKELPDLLEAALAVRALPLPRLDSARRQAIRRQMIAQYNSTPHARAQSRVASRPAARHNWLLRGLVSAFMVIALLFVGSAGLVQAASSSVPGDSLYSLKRTVESVELSFTSGDSRVTILNRFAQTRLDEVRTLVDRGQALSNTVLNDTVNSVQTALAVLPSDTSRNDLLGQANAAFHFAEAHGAISPTKSESLLSVLNIDSSSQNNGKDSNGKDKPTLTATTEITFTPTATLTPTEIDTMMPTAVATSDDASTPDAKSTKDARGPKRTKVPGDDGKGNGNGNGNGGNPGRGNGK